MNMISRRNALSSLVAATAVSGAALVSLSAARADTSGPNAPEKPRTSGLKSEMTPADREMNRKCINKTLTEAPTGKTWSWKNPKTGNGGTVTPTSPRKSENGQVCRDFNETVTLKDGRTENITGHACRNRDGSWNIA